MVLYWHYVRQGTVADAQRISLEIADGVGSSIDVVASKVHVLSLK
jgi:hypothetical protein